MTVYVIYVFVNIWEVAYCAGYLSVFYPKYKFVSTPAIIIEAILVSTNLLFNSYFIITCWSRSVLIFEDFFGQQIQYSRSSSERV